LLIDLQMDGATTAEQIREALAVEHGHQQEARDKLVERQQAELAEADKALALFRARLAELDAFIAFKAEHRV
jgi:hypothetical protein